MHRRAAIGHVLTALPWLLLLLFEHGRITEISAAVLLRLPRTGDSSAFSAGCRSAVLGSGPPAPVRMEELTVGIITHEHVAFAQSLDTYERNGLFELAGEVLMYMDRRSPEMEAAAAPYLARHPGVVRVLGESAPLGLTIGLLHLTANATRPYFLLLERDFQLVEPAACTAEQLRAAVALIAGGGAHVVRLRSQLHAGFPNIAERALRGRECDVFRGPQPNLACNFHYWHHDMSVDVPGLFWHCTNAAESNASVTASASAPRFVCSDSFFCNWTNNPQLFSLEWWRREYGTRVAPGAPFKRVDPIADLERWFNLEPGSWNSRKWVVAQGEGLFKHVDLTKYEQRR